jgi:hypothetical protein
MRSAVQAPGLSPSSALAEQLSVASRKHAWDPHQHFAWPDSIPDDALLMSPELISIYGTELWERLDEEQRRKLARFELCNFFSLTLQGERPLVGGMSDLLYAPKLSRQATEYLHHFVDEENKHMTMFGLFCTRYVGKVYPEKKMILPREYAKGEADVAFFCKVLVVEELGDYYNVVMQRDDRLHPLVQEINLVHHRDEARHLGFGRELTRELWDKHAPHWPASVLHRFRAWLAQYVKSSWADYYNPSMYRDAGLTRENGLADPYEVRQAALSDPMCRAHRERASKKLVTYFLRNGMLDEAPAL